MSATTLQPAARQADDFYATPRSAIEQLLDVEPFYGSIWEPACGDGAISRVLQERAYKVTSTDLVDRGYGAAGVDFLLEGWVIRRRVTFLKDGKEFSRSNGKGGIHTYAWFIWDRRHFGPVVLGWLPGEPCK